MKSYKNLRLRLLCKYAIGPIMENGEPEFGYRDMSGPLEVNLPTELMREASAEIELLESQRDELLAALKYHQEQTRPIQQTIDVIAKCEVKS